MKRPQLSDESLSDLENIVTTLTKVGGSKVKLKVSAVFKPWVLAQLKDNPVVDNKKEELPF